MPERARTAKLPLVFAVDEPTASAIRQACHEGGELSGIVEFRRHFPLIADIEAARRCVRAITGWAPQPPGQPSAPGRRIG